MATKYRTSNGEYLRIDEMRGYRIGWYLPYMGDFGTYVGECYTKGPKPTEKEDLEIWTSCEIADKFKEAQDEYGFVFENRKMAVKALEAINVALCNMDCPWPDWAVKAMSEGWTPPPNWKP